MKYLVVAIFLNLALVCMPGSKCSEEEIDYYVDLITENLLEVANYSLPTYYEGFELENEEAEPEYYGRFDFIIVGSGPAGSTLARRLTEIQEWNVLLVEGGTLSGDNFTDVPLMGEVLVNTKYNWGFNTTPQRFGCEGGVCSYPRGKGLGGSTLINGNILARGSPSDYDMWALELGLEGWSYRDVLPYFKKYENASALVDIDEQHRGFGGPLILENNRDIDVIDEAYFQAAKEYGVNITDYNGRNAIGVGLLQQSTSGGRRNSAFKAMLQPIENRTNLVVQVGSLVTKVLFDGDDNAIGIHFHHNHTKYVAYADKEIILSAGCVGSPQILLLSGVGPSEELDQLNISVVKHLPVGKEFRDHVGLYFAATTNYSFYLDIRTAISDYLEGHGFLSHPRAGAVSFFKVNGSVVEIIFGNMAQINLVNSTTIALESGSAEIVAFVPVLLHPWSVGSLRLASSNPLDFPLIDPNILSEEEDVETLVDALELITQLADSEAFKPFNLTLIPSSVCSDYTFKSRDYFRCKVLYEGAAFLHGISSCRMGTDETNSVVNNRLEVHGLRKLRVVDSSSVPALVTGHLFGTVYMVGEKAADIIKEDYGFL